MRIIHLNERSLSPRAAELVQFDMESIQRVISARHGSQPQLWLADPEQYEKEGRIQRDSTTPRLLAYSPEGSVLYVTDGCNSCSHELKLDLKSLSQDQLQRFAADAGIPLNLLTELRGRSI